MRNLVFGTFVLFSTSAFSGTTNSPNQSDIPQQSPTAEESMHQAMTTMCENMDTMPMTGHLDMDFLMMMISHHQSALEMSQAYLTEGSNPEIVAISTKIIEAQKKEIAEMNAMLKDLAPMDTPASN